VPHSSTDRDRRRLAVAAFAALALHALAIAALARLPALNKSLSESGGGFAQAGASRSGGGQGPFSLFVTVSDGQAPQVPEEIPDAGTGQPAPATVNRARADSLSDAVSAIADADSTGKPEGASGNGTGIPAGAGMGTEIDEGTGTGFGDGEPARSANRRFVTWLDGAIRAKLHYPERARARNAEGTVVVSLTVSPDGKTCKAVLADSSGDAALDRAAITLVKSLFPAKVAPETVFSAPVRIRFSLSPDP
jgi:TonB family protein